MSPPHLTPAFKPRPRFLSQVGPTPSPPARGGEFGSGLNRSPPPPPPPPAPGGSLVAHFLAQHLRHTSAHTGKAPWARRAGRGFGWMEHLKQRRGVPEPCRDSE